MIFTQALLKLTAESFHKNITTLGIEIKYKCKNFDLWAQFLANKNYSALFASLNNKGEYLELNAERLCEKLKYKNRELSFIDACELAANTIKPFLHKTSIEFSTLVSSLNKSPDISIFLGHDSVLSLISRNQPHMSTLNLDGGCAHVLSKTNENQPNLYSLNYGKYSTQEAAETYFNIILFISEQSFSHQLEIACSMFNTNTNQDVKRAEKEIRDNLSQFINELSAYIFKYIDEDQEPSEIIEIINKGFYKYLESREFYYLDATEPACGFIDSLFGALMTTIINSEYERGDGLELSDISYCVREKIKLHLSIP